MNTNDLTDSLRGITASGSPSMLMVASFFAGSWLVFAMISYILEPRMLKAWAANRNMQIVSLKKNWLFTGPFFGSGPAYFITVIQHGRRQTGWVSFRLAVSRDDRFVVHWTFPDPPNAP